MKIGKFLLFACVASLAWTTLIWCVAPHDGLVIYRCDSEISPDVPVQVKDECRKRILHGTI